MVCGSPDSVAGWGEGLHSRMLYALWGFQKLHINLARLFCTLS